MEQDMEICFARILTHEFFVSMLNPHLRGPTFTWEKFEDLAVRFAVRQIALSAPDLDPLRVESAARLEARHILKESQVAEWMTL